jgi:hypothetical protein
LKHKILVEEKESDKGRSQKEKKYEKKLTLRTLETIDKTGCLNFFLEIVSLNGSS